MRCWHPKHDGPSSNHHPNRGETWTQTRSRKYRTVSTPGKCCGSAQELIRIPSFKTEESDVARYLGEYLSQRGYEVQLQEVEPGRFQTIATLRGRGGGKSLMLNGHIDIDPLAMGWKRDPWTPSIEGDQIFGAGIRNMKSGVSSLITAAEAIRQSGTVLDGDLVLACVVGELQGGVGTTYLCRNGPLTDMAVVPRTLRRQQHPHRSRRRAGDGGPRAGELKAHQPQGGGHRRHRQDVQGGSGH